MPWDIAIVNAVDERNPLGERDDVIARFTRGPPSVVLQNALGPSPEILEMMPPIVRASMMRRKLHADFEADDFSIQFCTNDQPIIQSVGAEVRGNGSPLPTLNGLCTPNGWAVIDVATGVDSRSRRP